MHREKSYCVYKHTNKHNGKVYIGITCQKPEYRWKPNGDGYIECPYFWNAIEKYGWDSFDHEILFDELNAEEANRMEIELIAQYDSTNPERGYNISAGGFGTNSETMSEMWRQDDYRERMVNAMKESWKDPEKRARRSERAKQRWSNAEFKESVRQSIKKSCGTSVVCVETGVVYTNICDAEQTLHLNHSNICRAIREGSKCGGFHWQKVDNVFQKA